MSPILLWKWKRKPRAYPGRLHFHPAFIYVEATRRQHAPERFPGCDLSLFLPVTFRLEVKQAGIRTIARHQFGMAAEFMDSAFREHNDSVRHAYR